MKFKLLTDDERLKTIDVWTTQFYITLYKAAKRKVEEVKDKISTSKGELSELEMNKTVEDKLKEKTDLRIRCEALEMQLDLFEELSQELFETYLKK